MSARTPRPLARSLVATAALVAGILAAAPAANADEASDAPVTMNDTISIDAGSVAQVDVLANDTDPNGDELAICRVQVPNRVPLFVDDSDGTLFVGSTANKSGTYTITYYACDFDYLTPATLTVTVTKIAPIKATKVAGHPGRVKFTNPGDKKVIVLYGSRREESPDGQVGVASHRSVVISTKRHNLFYIGFLRRTGSFAGQGTVRNIAQPRKQVAPSPAAPFSKQGLREWRSAV